MNEKSAEDISSAAAHVCSEATGCVTKILDCQHQHDETCGCAPAVSGHPCQFVCPICSQAEDTQTAPYYLLLIHTLAYHDNQYGFSEVIRLTEEDLQDGYDLRRHALEKDGMAVTGISCFNPETGDPEEVQALSPDSFAQGGDPEDGSNYFAAQALIEYQVLDGYRPVLQGDSAQLEDPYGVMPLTSFEGGNIKDITFVPADVLTVRLEYKYSPTGGLAGMDAADSQVFQIKVDNVKRDTDGNITGAPSFTETWDLPHHNGTSYPTLEGFRIVLNPTPLNQFLNDPVRAEQAMSGDLSAAEIQEALESDKFSVNTSDPDNPVYQWQVDNPDNPPATYDDYPTGNYGNRYSDKYNAAWDSARKIESTEVSGYTAQAVSQNPPARQGANALTDPQLTLELTADQCKAALESDKDLTVTVYYRRNAGFYYVGHWVPKAGLSPTDVTKYTNDFSDYNKLGVGPFDQGYLMVYLERKQGRVGALTNARPNPPDAPDVENILRSFTPKAVNQKTIEADTRVDILYEIADRYGLIFQVEGTYIPRQYVNKGYTVSFTAGEGDNSMTVTDSSGKPVTGGYTHYTNPTRQGYSFAGWKYEVHSDVTDPDVTVENGKHYKTIKVKDPGNSQTGTEWTITDKVLSEAVVIRDTDSGEAKMIYLYPVWTPDMANVRVVFWTEDLGGGNKDVQVTVTKDETNGQADYLQNLDGSYINGTPTTVGGSFSNVGSFTFMAPTNSELDLSMSGGQFATGVTDSFETTGESVDKTGTDNKTGTLDQLIKDMFPVRMPDVEVSTVNATTGKKDTVDTSKFYHPYQVEGEKDKTVKYTVAADGSTVINVYYARNVYTLDFTYYGEITKGSGAGSGTNYNGDAGLVVATNTIGYSVRDKDQITGTFDYDYQSSSSDNLHKNRWQLVDITGGTPRWTVPKTLTISAKYDANLQEVWPVSRGEVIQLNMPQTELDNHMKNVAVFMSWGATAGPFNQTYRDGSSNESTIIGNYRAMGTDIIAAPDNPSTVHHLVGYWWNQNQSYYRRNACYEVPGLTSKILIDAVGSGPKDVTTFDLNNRQWVHDENITPQGDWKVNVAPIAVSAEEKTRRDTVYLVPIDSTLNSYFEDYRSNFIRVDATGEPEENGGYYAVRRIGLEDGSKVYALGRQAMSVSNNYILAQEPTDMPNMTKVSFKYVCEGKEIEKPVYADHDSRTWDDFGRTAPGKEPKGFVALGTVEKPYDIWFYYDRERFTIHYMVASRNSSAGEYEIGNHETIYGQNMKRYNLELPSDAARMYSDHERFKNYWTPVKNTGKALPGTTSPTNGLNAGNYTRLCPDSAENGAGDWVCKYWSLDRSGSGVMDKDDWDRMVTGNLRVFAQWTPPTYRVKFDFDGGSYNGSDTFDIQTVNANVGYTSSGNAIPSPTRDGFVFNGWTWYEAQSDMTAGRPRGDFTFETPITRDMVLVAKWDAAAKAPYNYKIWYLTDEQDPGSVTLPNVDGQWLDENRGTPQPDTEHAAYTHVLGCQYVEGARLPEGTVLSLAAVAIPGYAPVRISTTLALETDKNGTSATNTGNVAYFYYKKSKVKSYRVRYQLWDKTGDEGIIPGFTTESVVADSTYFTPGKGTWQDLRDAGYYLVQMNTDGTAKTEAGEPIAARSYEELSAYVNSEIARFDAQEKGTDTMVVTFKVAPFHYTIQYHVGTVKRDGAVIEPTAALKGAMQAALNQLSGEAVLAAVAAGKNPTRYVVADFDNGYSFTLKNPAAVKDLEDASKEWRFTGWSPAEGTNVIFHSRSVAGEYPTLEIERSEGDLEFLANWELTDRSSPSVDPGKPPVDPENPPVDPENPPVDPENPPVDPENPPVDPENPPTVLPDPNIPDAPELITILENGVPTTYRKVWDPETETWIYITDEDVPLHYVDVPETGGHGVFPWGLLSTLSLFGLVAMFFQGRKKKKDIL